MRSFVKGLLVSLATLVLLAALFGAAELWARRRFPNPGGGDADQALFQMWLAGPCYRTEGWGRGRVLHRVPPPRFYGSAGFIDNSDGAVPFDKAPDLRRVVVIGESSASLLERALPAQTGCRDCAHRYQVLQCSTPGGDLTLLERRFDEVIHYAPDAVVVVFGHNLNFHVPADRVQLWIAYLRAHSRLVSWLTPPAPSVPQESEAERLRAFDEALRRMGRRAADAHVRLVATPMPSNLRFAPRASDAERDTPEYLDAVYEDALGHRERATAMLRALLASRGGAFWHYRLGGWLEAGGDRAGALDELRAAAEQDPAAFRASRATNDVLRAVARDGLVALHDSEQALVARAPGGIPGWESFHDNCHLLPGEVKTEALAIFDVVSDGDGCRPAAHPGPACAHEDPSRDPSWRVDDLLRQVGAAAGANARLWLDNLESLSATLARDATAAEDLARIAGIVPPEAALRIIAGLWSAGHRDEARALNARVRGAVRPDSTPHPTMAEAWVQKGLFDLSDGHADEAARSFAEALKIRPDRADARALSRRLAEPVPQAGKPPLAR
jgi:tetratricopeptide (TPR) repeat protein